MKITFEPGDTVTVEDHTSAGKAAACDVELIYQKPDGAWVCSIIDGEFDESGEVEVHEQFLNP
jgi:hypothetical protein